MSGADDGGPPLVGLVEVVFLGGPYHAKRMTMAHPDFLIELEQRTGERTTYSRRAIAAELRDTHYVNVATYAKVGLSDDELARLIDIAARLS